jgi:hypothetical protein
MNDPIQVVVAHKGAREHYLAARALQRRGQLAALITDWYSPFPSAWSRRIKSWSPALARALGSRSDELPRDRVVGLNAFGLCSRWALNRAAKCGALVEATCENDRAFAERVSRLALPQHQAFLAYSYAALEALRAENERGVLTLVDQIDPGRTEWEMVRDETARWPDYADPEPEAPSIYYERARAEWQAAQAIIVNSEWSRKAIVQQGADAGRIEVIPLAYEAGDVPMSVPERVRKELTVLWLGSVILRKGIPYLMEAARRLVGEPVRFVIAGPIGIHERILRQAPSNIQWLGPVPRSEARQLYLNADLFVLPTISDGFAITQVEALAHGIPVITTPNCGAVVEDGRTGFLVPARDASSLTAAIQRFIRDTSLAASMREACLTSAAAFSLDAFADRLHEVVVRRRALQKTKGEVP